PFLFTSASSAFPSFSPRAQKTSVAPAAAKTRTHPSPIPLDPPVTSVTLSAYVISARRGGQLAVELLAELGDFLFQRRRKPRALGRLQLREREDADLPERTA